MMAYRILGWDQHFENNKSRERERCSFCCIPNKQDGLGYGLLLREADGESLYGAFVAAVLIVSKQRVRFGWLTDNGMPPKGVKLPAECPPSARRVPAGCPLSARQISVKCQFKEVTIQRMLEVCSTNEIGWMEGVLVECPPSAPAVPAECPRSAPAVPAECPPSALERKKERRKEGEGNPPLKLSGVDTVKFDGELKRVNAELAKLGRATDYAPTHPARARIVELGKRQQELRGMLGVKI